MDVSTGVAQERRRVLAELMAERQGRDGLAVPLSSAEERLWFLARLEPDSAQYNIPYVFRLEGHLDDGALARALAEVVRRHDVLRSVLRADDGRSVRVVQPVEAWRLGRRDLSSLPDREAALRSRMDEDARRPFRLEEEPPFRAELIRLGAGDHVLLLCLHHVASDGWSMGVFFRDLAALYDAARHGRPSPLPGLEVRYADYVLWERAQEHGDWMREGLRYWERQLASASTQLDLPCDAPPAGRAGDRGARLPFALDPSLARAVQAVCARERVTPYMVLLAAFGALLARQAGQEEVLIGSPVINRPRPEFEPIVGLFANTAVLRIDAAGDPTFQELLRRVRRASVDAYTHQHVPLERVVAAVRQEGESQGNPLFRVTFSLESGPEPSLSLAGITVRPLETATQAAKFDLSLTVRSTGAALEGLFSYRSDLFRPATVERMARGFEAMLQELVRDPARRVGEVELLRGADRERVLVEWNATEAPAGSPVASLISAQARRAPEAPAVAAAGERLSYGELERRSNQLAHHLRGRGVGPEVRVGVCLERSPELIVALLAVLKAGGAYVPLDPDYPAERLAHVLADARAPLVLTRSTVRERLEAAGSTILCLDEARERIESEPADPLAVEAGAENVAYVIYTSGSTGAPKGVMCTHAGLANLVEWHRRTFDVTPDDRATLLASVGFDASAWEVWPYLCAGASLHVVPEETRTDSRLLSDWLDREGITLGFVPTPLAEALLREPRLPRGMRYLLTGGDQLHAGPSADAPFTLINNYGPTEATVVATSGPVPPGQTASAPDLGRPIANTRAYVLDAGGRPAPVDAWGELYLGGTGLARGYLGRAGETASRFVPDPFSGTGGARLYRTGDRVRWRDGGVLEFGGRVDEQVKIRGFRIEPGEVEAVLRAQPGVRECVVVAREDGGERRLVGYVAAGQEVDPEALRTAARERLPGYMVPAAVVRLEQIPRTPHGKLDRRALPAPGPAGETVGYVAPRTPVEEALAAIWAEVLSVPRVGIHDDFFALGGHSLAASRVFSRLRATVGAELALGDLFDAPTIAELAARAGPVRVSAPAPSPLPPLRRLRHGRGAPLSPAQERLWFLAQLQPDSPFYNVPAVLRLAGSLDADALERALAEVVRRHQALRTTFGELDGVPVQVIHPAGGWRLEREDLSALPAEQREREAREQAGREVAHRFDLAEGPLFRARLLRLSDREHLLLLTQHHIVTDAWSTAVLFRELGALYEAEVRGEDAFLPNLPVQYADYAVWQRELLESGALAHQLDWWRARLAGAPPVLALPYDRPRPAVQTHRGALLRFDLPAGLARRLGAVARREGVTPFMLLLAALQVLLARWSGQTDVVVGTPVAGRVRSELEPLIGFFDNTLPLRTDVSGDPAIGELIGRVREVTLGAFEHQELPFERLVDELQVERGLSHNPLFQVLFTFLGAGGDGFELDGVTVEPLPAELHAAKFDLALGLQDDGDGMSGAWEYATDLFDGATIARMSAHYRTLLEGIAAAPPEKRIGELPLLDEAERRQVLHGWNQTDAPLPADGCIHHGFEAWAARTPDAVAAVFGDEVLRYGELDRRANRLAHRLRSRGVGAEARVGICVERGMEMLVAVLAVLKSGGACVPLDPDHPRERLDFLVRDSGVALVLTQARLADRLPSRPGRILLDADEGVDAFPDSRSDGGAGAENLAYVLYTSGSTGRPKGVEMTHGALANLFAWQCRQEGAAATTLQFAPLGFDVSFQEIFATWGAGGRLVLVDDATRRDPHRLLDEMEAQGVERAFLPVAMLHQLADAAAGRALDGLRLREVVTAGEQLQVTPAVADFLRRAGARLENQYGPTECHVVSFHRLGVPGDACPELPPIGRPIANLRLYVLDGGMSPAPIGVPGELFIGGRGVGRGYRGRPALTAERFVPDPHGPTPGAHLYRTGDRARFLASGEIEYLGRTDRQVKIRGFRVEPGEIQAVLQQHPGVRECVVAVREDGGEKRLVAYVVGDAGQEPPPAELRAFLRERLPEYMVPAAFVPLQAVPLTANGKVDHRALPAPGGRREAGAEYAEPRTPLEEVLSCIWAEVLRVERVGIRDNFFELGGHSLAATRVVARAQTVVGRSVPLGTLFQEATVAHMAEVLAQSPGSVAPSPLAPLFTTGSRRPLFCVHAADGHILSYAALARRLGPDQPFYGLKARGLDGEAPPHDRVEEMAEEYLKAVRAVQPSGPYHFVGWSIGGLIAFEMAQQLREQGEEVGLVGLFDTMFPRPGGRMEDAAILVDMLADLMKAASPEPLDFPFLRAVGARLRELPLEEQLGEVLREAERVHALPAGFGIGHLRALLLVRQSQISALRAYTPRPYAGKVTYFEAAQKHPAVPNPPELWNDFALGGLEIHTVPGTHATMLVEPQVAVLAEVLARSLEAAADGG